MSRYPPVNCGYCGRFTTGVDAYAPWGGACDLEPPDPVVLCRTCADAEYRVHLDGFLKRGIPAGRPYWQPPAAWRDAKSTAKAIFRHRARLRHRGGRPVLHERVRYEASGTRQVWYCRCGRPERHPAHDVEEARRLHVRFCRFERAVGRNMGTFHVQEWCACGWTTGRLTPGDGYPKRVDYLGSGSLMREHLKAHRPAVSRELEVVF